MGHYKSNLRDIEFNLFEVLGRGDVLGTGPYEDVDVDTAREMLKEVARLAENELAESFEDSDRHPPVYDPTTQAVTMPESFTKSFNAYRDSGFWSIDLNAELGGTVVPPSVRWGVNEMLLGSNPAVAMFAASYGFAKLLHALGNDEQKKLAEIVGVMNDLFSGNLTEADLVGYVTTIRGKLLENETLAAQAANNSEAQFAMGDFKDILMDIVIEGQDSHNKIADQLLKEDRVFVAMQGLLARMVWQKFQQRR